MEETEGHNKYADPPAYLNELTVKEHSMNLRSSKATFQFYKYFINKNLMLAEMILSIEDYNF